MTDRELKKRYKKLGIALIVILFLIIALSVYTLCSKKAELSIYTNAEYTDNMQALGIEEEEFKQYLSVFGNLVDEKSNKSLQTLNMATKFIDDMCPTYEMETNDAGQKCYETSIINEVVKELNGEVIKENFDVTGSNYSYDNTGKIYIQNKESNKTPYCIEIENITKNGDEIEVTYKLVFVENNQIAVEQEKENEVHTIKAVIIKNVDYKYSKYFVKSIEK